jgi:plasmid maintenance system antidote protein VapI
MSNVSDLSHFRTFSFRGRLNALYSVLDETEFSRDATFDERRCFGQKMQGEFIAIFRQRTNYLHRHLAEILQMTVDKIYEFEEGRTKMEDVLFFRLCHFLGATNEVSVFLEKLEEAYRPGLSEARKKSANILASHGFRFSDTDKYDSTGMGRVLPFGPKGTLNNQN